MNDSYSYRNYNAYDYEDLSDSKPHDRYVSADDVVALLNNIESDVSAISDLLFAIEGLTEIECIKRKAQKLSDKLY